jgi:UDP-N-acetylglucosamine diphosphorylase/glucosamine-1-phosphate N-acetyltransferase
LEVFGKQSSGVFIFTVMNIILFDDKEIRDSLLPLTYTRPTAALRVGIFTIAEKWEKHLNASVSFLTQDYLSNKYPLKSESDNLIINGAVCPNINLLEELKGLSSGEALVKDDVVLAARSPEAGIPDPNAFVIKTCNSTINIIDKPWRIFKTNAAEIHTDFELVTKGRSSAPVDDPHTVLYGKDNIFIEQGADIKSAVINANKGPIYIGKDTEIQEGAIIRGAFALGEGSHIKMGSKIRGDSTVGPFCNVGGEISNSVIFSYSNKSHDGYLGNSVIAEWCNIGADTNTSNLKNNYTNVKLWNYPKQELTDTGETFCGLIMGDHSKCGINTMFNTGTVAGISANIFGAGYPRKFIPSFAWGGPAGFTTYKLDKAFEVAKRVMERRNQLLDEREKEILSHIYKITAFNRHWEEKKEESHN